MGRTSCFAQALFSQGINSRLPSQVFTGTFWESCTNSFAVRFGVCSGVLVKEGMWSKVTGPGTNTQGTGACCHQGVGWQVSVPMGLGDVCGQRNTQSLI